jgi:peptidoglycan hydrolase-like protein with peptidoglycan-binding domain
VDEPTRQLLNRLWSEELAVEEDTPIQEVEGEKIITTPLFTKTLKMGSVDAQVVTLQKTLNKHGFIVSKTNAGSLGKESDTFAGKTKSALMLFQKKYKLAQTGQVDTPTRAVLNGLAR